VRLQYSSSLSQNSSVLLNAEKAVEPVSVWAATWDADGLACQVSVTQPLY
jgi:hypothetical protein